MTVADVILVITVAIVSYVGLLKAWLEQWITSFFPYSHFALDHSANSPQTASLWDILTICSRTQTSR